MKTFYYIILASIIALSSCKKENTDVCNDNLKYFNTKDAKYCIPHGYLFYGGPWSNFENMYSFGLIFNSDDININLKDTTFSGKGESISFMVLCPTEYLSTDTYPFYKFDTIPAISGAGYYKNYDFTKHYKMGVDDELPGDFANISSGLLSINEYTNGEYAISFDGMDENGDSISAEYNGELIYIDYSK